MFVKTLEKWCFFVYNGIASRRDDKTAEKARRKKTMKNTVKITARAKASLLMIAGDAVKAGMTKNEVVKAICKRKIKKGMVENGGEYNAMLAVALAFYAYKKAQYEGKRPYDCIASYAHFKHITSEKLDDYGAFGDTVETCIRIACKPASLVSFNDLHVKRQNEVDITIRGEKCEVGTNGKTFLESEENSPMEGKYEKIVYGVFSNDEKESIFQLLENGNTEKALESLLKMVYVFDKETFYTCMTEKTGRGSMYQYKPSLNRWQVIYNPSKHGAFLQMVENEKIPTLGEYLKK